MLPERREELVRRRRELRERQTHESREQHLRAFVAPLDRAGVRYELVSDDEPLTAWLTDRFTFDLCSSIDWSTVAGRRHVDADGRTPAAWLSGLAAEMGVADPLLTVVFASAADSSLRLQYSELVRRADVVIDLVWQTWVFDPSDDWLVEFHHDLGWSWGKVASRPPAPTSAGRKWPT